jgi:hypothetical protein
MHFSVSRHQLLAVFRLRTTKRALEVLEGLLEPSKVQLAITVGLIIAAHLELAAAYGVQPVT